ncbi:MAG: helix-turn-helix domain-containing protein [Bacteroidota bacterium]
MEPTLDNWTTLFLLASSTGLFLSIALLMKSRKAELFLMPSLIIGLFSIVLFQYVLFWTNYQSVFPYLRYLPNACLGLIPVLVIHFSHRLLSKTPHRALRLLYLPLAFGILFNVCFWLGIYPIQSDVSDFVRYTGRILFLGLNPWVVVGLYIISIIVLFKLQSHLDGARKGYFTAMITTLSLFTIAFASYFVLVRFPFFNSSWDYAISIVMSGTIYFLGGSLITRSTSQIFPEAKGSTELLDEKSVDEFFDDLDLRMRKECHYRKDDLRLEWLADKMQIPRNYLSYIINSKSGKNFNAFINDYRVQEASELLVSRTDLTVKDIYFQVGFSNKATFYQAFKKRHNCTPTEYRMVYKSQSVSANGLNEEIEFLRDSSMPN